MFYFIKSFMLSLSHLLHIIKSLQIANDYSDRKLFTGLVNAALIA